ncbi:MAG TPA: 30S ribosomal protein S16 [Acidimicrobiia bacterium]|nr:30S ribosomal protein S16 [Acidimicrobiia bacterium]
MAVKIRLMRVGKRKQPSYRVVVADSRSPRDGRVIETIGRYGPRHEPSQVEIDGDKALEWLRKGAQPTESVQKLLAVTGVWATFEAEKGGPIVTKLNRRGFLTGRGPAPSKGKKNTPAEDAPAEKAEAAPEAEVADAPEATAEAAPDATAEAAPDDAGEQA